jgi:hypothetical protein
VKPSLSTFPIAAVDGVCSRCGGVWLKAENDRAAWIGVLTEDPDCPECASWFQLTDAELQSRGCRPRDG